MHKTIWRNGQLIPDDSGKRFLVRALLASIEGVSPEEFAENEIRRRSCEWCAMGLSVNEERNHTLCGLVMPCEYENQENK